MNQNDNEDLKKQEEDSALPINEQPKEQPAPEAQELPEPQQTTESADVGQEPKEEAQEPRKAVSWSFGQVAHEPQKKRRDVARFALIFGIVFAICVGLLGMTLVLGSGGIRLIREIRTDRTVFVEQTGGEESGILSPEQAAHVVKESTVAISVNKPSGSGAGSGFIYREDGIILTNEHVVSDANWVQVILSDGSVHDAEVVGKNAMADVAVLRIEKTGLKAAKIGSSASLLVGEQVLAAGTPASIDFAGSVTFGRVSAVNRLFPVRNEEGEVVKKWTLIQTDATVNPGNSGGPLANMYGEVVGMVLLKITTYGGSSYEGMGFALPIDGVKAVADAILKTGHFYGQNPLAEGPSRLGVQGYGVEARRWYFLDPNQGVLVSDVQKTAYHYAAFSGAYVYSAVGGNVKGKLEAGDIITSINGFKISSFYQLGSAVNRYYIGETVEIKLMRYRSGNVQSQSSYEEITVRVVLTEG